MNIYVIDHNTVHLPLIAKLVTEKCHDVSSITFRKTHHNHDELIDQADIIIISGGTWLVHLNPGTHKRLIKKLVESNKPIFGICLGAEALATYFGATLVQLEHRVKGLVGITSDSLIGRDAQVYSYHNWAIESVPDDLKVLATSETGVEAFKHKKLPVWGVQFHPEAKRGKNQGHQFFEAFIREVSKNSENITLKVKGDVGA